MSDKTIVDLGSSNHVVIRDIGAKGSPKLFSVEIYQEPIEAYEYDGNMYPPTNVSTIALNGEQAIILAEQIIAHAAKLKITK